MDQRERFEAWIRARDGHPYAGQFANLMWAAWQAAEAAALERAAQLIEPKNSPDDWTEYARIKAECAADIRKLAAPAERGVAIAQSAKEG